ncbi:hypothetical protein CLIB1444_02S05556 [[Candida] jaroonii]|uniref:Uncharacterized protein n=1 Tax=[Candida] jaroonii TaxID=467808 RepID=A0ACA9Y3T4_9ASCO|nr:hypothetical protein CLIB1444_02S05556 [[Candida] jaroonii]
MSDLDSSRTAPLCSISRDFNVRRHVSEPGMKTDSLGGLPSVFSTVVPHSGTSDRPPTSYSETIEQTHELSRDSEGDFSIQQSPSLNVRTHREATKPPSAQLETILQSSQADDDSASFEVETEDSPQSIFTPEPEINYNSPPLDTLTELGIRKSIISDFSFTSGDAYQDYLEDRLVSWRPSESQHNTNIILNGKHPYNAETFGQPPRTNSGLFSFNWFSTKNNNDIEKQLNHQSPQEPRKSNSTAFYTASEFSSPNQEIRNLLKTVQFQPNSSNSFLPRTKTLRSNAAIHNTTAGESPTELAYTPYAIPLSEFELNYNRRSRGEEVDINAHYDLLGDEMLGIVNGSENFITSCFQGLSSLFQC